MQLHRLNTDFQWRQADPPYQLITPAQAQAYAELGGFVLEDAFTAAEVAALVAELDPLEAARNADLKDADPAQPNIARAGEIVFQAHVVPKSEVARQFARHPVMKALCQDLLGPDIRLYWDQLVYKRPGTAQEFPWHQDNGYTFVSPQQYLTCWVALTDATPDNGCPWIMPGLHRLGTLAHRWTDLGFRCEVGEGDPLALPLRAGSIAVFSSLTPHRTGPNLTGQVRKAYILQYAADGAVVHPYQGEPHLANDAQRQFLL